MSIIRVHHVQFTIPVDNEAEARAFYIKHLGLEEIPKPDSLQGRGGFWMKVGDIDVHVGVEDSVDRKKTKTHIAYQVQDINAMHEKIEAYGLPIKKSIPIEGFHRFECRDPFDNRIEFIQPIT